MGRGRRSTEDLRVALTRYRSFFERLLIGVAQSGSERRRSLPPLRPRRVPAKIRRLAGVPSLEGMGVDLAQTRGSPGRVTVTRMQVAWEGRHWFGGLREG